MCPRLWSACSRRHSNPATPCVKYGGLRSARKQLSCLDLRTWRPSKTSAARCGQFSLTGWWRPEPERLLRANIRRETHQHKTKCHARVCGSCAQVHMKYRLRAETLFLAPALSRRCCRRHLATRDVQAVNLIDRHMTALPVLRRRSAEHRFTCHASSCPKPVANATFTDDDAASY